jgi:FkbM family methyltransferase
MSEDGQVILEGRDFKFYSTGVGTHTASNSFTDACELKAESTFWHPKAGDVVLDVGAAFGTYTLPSLAIGARVYAFEPHPDISQHLMKNVELNNWQDRFTLLTYGLGDKDEYLPYDLVDLNTQADSDALKIQICTLDHVVNALGIKKIDWIKVDIENMEIAFLKGAQQTINQYTPNILIEIHDESYVDYIRRLYPTAKIQVMNLERIYMLIEFNK